MTGKVIPVTTSTAFTFLKLGRVSNLPTVWSNILAAIALSGGVLQPVNTVILVSALSLMYVAGMFLNDAMDADWDKEHNLPRPIPMGEISRSAVLSISIALLLSGLLLLLCLQFFSPNRVLQASLAGITLMLFIVLYNGLHKRFSHSVWFMGACRFMVYLTTAVVLGSITHDLLLTGFTLMLYISGVTYLARTEHSGGVIHLWPMILLLAPLIIPALHLQQSPEALLFMAIFSVWIIRQLLQFLRHDPSGRTSAIGGLLAAIPLIDACNLAMVNALPQALICLMIFLLVPRFHRMIAGT